MRTALLLLHPLKAIIIPLTAHLIIVLGTTWALAQGPHIELTTVAEVEREVLNAVGQKTIQRIPATQIRPGETVIFTTHYRNTGTQMAENAIITNPIPEYVLFQQGSVRGVNTVVTYSIDGGKSYHTPEKLIVIDKAGRQFPARPKDYTHIRWTFDKPLAPGAAGTVSFRATIK
jgi:uncharacterized repeat protein (TIGR01451 family)